MIHIIWDWMLVVVPAAMMTIGLSRTNKPWHPTFLQHCRRSHGEECVTSFSLTTNFLITGTTQPWPLAIKSTMSSIVLPLLRIETTRCQKAIVYSVEFFIRLVQFSSMKARISACRSSLGSMHIRWISFALVNLVGVLLILLINNKLLIIWLGLWLVICCDGLVLNVRVDRVAIWYYCILCPLARSVRRLLRWQSVW